MVRLKKFLKRAAIGSLLVLSGLVLIFAFFNWRASRQVEAILAPLRESVTTDPFDGSTMKFKVSDESVRIYSVGENFIDEGGSLTDNSDIGIEVTRVAE